MAETTTETTTPTAVPTTLRRAGELLERARRGRLAEHWIRLAAHLGDSAARLALQQADQRFTPARRAAPKDPRVARRDLIEWIRGLAPWGPEAWIRVALVALEAAHETSADRAATRAARAAVTRWLSCPCPQHARLAAAAASTHLPDEPDPLRTGAAALAKSVVTAHQATQSIEHALACVLDATWRRDPAALRVAIERRLIPWALGYSDPCVDARGDSRTPRAVA